MKAAYFILISVLLFSCAEKPLEVKAYNNGNINGWIIGNKNIDHFNTIELKHLEHELVGDTKADLKTIGVIVGVDRVKNQLILESEANQYFIAEFVQKVLLPKNITNQIAIIEGTGQMKNDINIIPDELKKFRYSGKSQLHVIIDAAIIISENIEDKK